MSAVDDTLDSVMNLGDAYLVTTKPDRWGQTYPRVIFAMSISTARRAAMKIALGGEVDLCVKLESKKAIDYLSKRI
jgi:hypothetical protein